MTMTDTNEAPKAAPRKARKAKRGPAKPRDEKAGPDYLAGLTRLDCGTKCYADGACAISCGGVCIHPLKAGAQSEHLKNPEILKRYRAAQAKLGVKPR